MVAQLPVDILPLILMDVPKHDLVAISLANRLLYAHATDELYQSVDVPQDYLDTIADALCGPRMLGRKVKSLTLAHADGTAWRMLDSAEAGTRAQTLNRILQCTPNLRKLDLRMVPAEYRFDLHGPPTTSPTQSCHLPQLTYYAFTCGPIRPVDAEQVEFLRRHPTLRHLGIITESYTTPSIEEIPRDILPNLTEIDVFPPLLDSLIPGRAIQKVRINYSDAVDATSVMQSLQLSKAPVGVLCTDKKTIHHVRKEQLPILLSSVKHLIIESMHAQGALFDAIYNILVLLPLVTHCTLHCQFQVERIAFTAACTRLLERLPHALHITIGWQKYYEFTRTLLEPVDTTELYSQPKETSTS